MIKGASRASSFARTAGEEVRQSRVRRHLTQKVLASRVGLSRSRLAAVEAGNGAALPLTNWFALADTLGRFLRVELARDPLQGPTDAGHLDIQQLVIKLRTRAGFDERMIELPGHSGRGWTDVALIKRAARLLVLIECVNVIGDLGQSLRSSDRKETEARQLAVALGGEGAPFAVSVCWVVRDSARNREIVRRYAELFAARFPGSSRDWALALTTGTSPPAEPGLVWCDGRASRLFARRASDRPSSPNR